MTNEEGWRPLNEGERAIVELLCGLPRNKALEHLKTLDDCQVRQAPLCVDHCPTIEFQTSPRWQTSPIAPMRQGASGLNKADGLPFDVSLFEREGQLELLEFTPYGEMPLAYLPSVDELDVWTLDS